MADYTDSWALGDDLDIRERFKAPKGQTEPITFRCFTQHLRVLDEIIQSGIDPRLKTKSDCLQDSVSLFISEWLKNYSDGVSSTTLRLFSLERARAVREARNNFLHTIDEEIEAAKDEADREELERIHHMVVAEKDDKQDRVPPSYVDALDKRITDLNRLLDHPTWHRR